MAKTNKDIGQVSGFPEWLPHQREVELEWRKSIQEVYRSHGYSSVETRAVEPLSLLAGNGEDVGKEIYAVNRHVADATSSGDNRLGLHFDQTVPFARYTVENMNDLVFPFKRYQMQKVWRGERAQQGRYREFTQCDIDVVDIGKLSPYFDGEVSYAALEALSSLNIGKFSMRVNNRKVLEGAYRSFGAEDTIPVLSAMDKIEKIGPENVASLLRERTDFTEASIGLCLRLSQIKGSAEQVIKEVRSLGIKSELMEEGLDELSQLMEHLDDTPKNTVASIDMSITRGLDYYTGNVFETAWQDCSSPVTVCAGGRYENLTGDLIDQKMPGTGISIGLTRLMGLAISEGRLPKRAPTPADVMVAHMPGVTQKVKIAKARMLRENGFNVDVYPDPISMKKQMKLANKKQVPFVYFIGTDGREDEVKDMESFEQKPLRESIFASKKADLDLKLS